MTTLDRPEFQPLPAPSGCRRLLFGSALPPPAVGRQIRLRDGRWLGYAEFGDPAGRPIFFFHGLPGSRLFRHPDDSIATALGVRLIVPDRPGVGLSSFKPKRTLLDWPSDVKELAEALGLDRFAIAGVSGGGPFTAACAYQLGPRLTAAGFVSSAGPMTAPDATAGMASRTRLSFQVASLGCLPWWALYPSMVSVVRLARQQPEKIWQRALESSPEPDRIILLRPEVKAIFLESLPETYRQGPRGHIDDALLIAREWGFPLQDISVPTFLWHGTADIHASPAMGQYLTETIPRCQATFIPGAGHLLMFRADFWHDMLTTLISATPS